MSSASKPVINFGIENAENGSISELISMLRSAFQPTDFDKVQQILITREETMKRTLNEMSIEIENRKIDYDLMERKHGEVELKKLEIDFELKKCERERDELREQITRLNEEQRVHHDRSRRAEERYDKLLKDFTKVENEKREVILHLKVKSTNLECVNAAKRRAEGEVEAWKKKFGELELRVLRLEEDTAMLVNGDYSVQKKIGVDLRNLDEHLGVERLVSDEMKGEKAPSENGKSQNQNGSPNLGHSQPEESLSNFHEKVHNMAGVVSACDSPVIESNGFQAAGPHSSGAIIEISDSDDEMLTVCRKTCLSNVCSSGVILSDKETTTQRFVKGARSDQTREENGKTCMENCCLASMSKRKLDSCIDIWESEKDHDDDDYKTPIGKRKTKLLQKLIREDKSSSVNDCLAMPDSGSTGIAKAVSPSRQGPMFIRRCEDKTGGEKNSGSPLSKFTLDGADSSDSEDSSASSGDETYTDSYIEKKIAEMRGRRDNKTWAFEMDMRSAFERDPELCMNAMCALYRQQTFTDKSIEGSLFSKNRGFDQFDIFRGTILAKFLIGGDPQGKLKKSVLELQQYDPKGLDDCRKIANRHSRKLFEIYQKKEDPFFLPS
ncbi:hypothetical protein F0562_011597 [Nyssa sinensis]|uniref:Uncharacterized protein n=1 Tax=Nyssa sinensis TaxID=561372 RepID=A0A5J4ZSV6_9ASTE|nr:hypothetical protein F0562_011597 [Nyssa sinensis]